MSSGFFNKFLAHLDKVEPEDIQNYLNQLSREKEFLLKVLEALQEGLVVIDNNERILYINPAARSLFPYENEQAIGEPFHEVLSKNTSIATQPEWQKMLAALRSGKTINRDIRVSYPEEKLLNLYLAPIDADDISREDQPAFVLILRDHTDNRKLTDDKIESERLNTLTTLAAGVAHELGNPLNSLTIQLQLLKRILDKDVNLSAENKDGIDKILAVTQGEIQRLDFTIKQFLGAIRPTIPQRIWTDVNKLLLECLAFLEPELKDRGISHQLELHESMPLLEVDPEQIKQAFFNLIHNAAQSINDRGELLIRSDLDGEGVSISIQDNGTGISPEDMGKVFEPYFTTRQSGTGLGLLIVRKIIREHGGEIELESEEGEGTTVILHLPRSFNPLRFLETTSADQEIAS